MRELAAATIAVALFGIVVAALMLFPLAVIGSAVGVVLVIFVGFVLLIALMSSAS